MAGILRAILWFIAALVAIPLLAKYAEWHSPTPSPPLQVTHTGPAPTPPQSYRCPEIEPGAIWLAEAQREAYGDLVARAQQLNSVGVCVLDGSYGTASGTYYLNVKPTWASRPEQRRYARDELRPH